MRPIKFRAWDKKYKVMDDDFLIDCDGKIWDAPRMTYDTPNREIAREDDDRFILMQFTGLHDKNGKEIYEGDILECISDIVRLITNEKTGEIHRKICSVVYVPEKGHFTTQLPNGHIESGFGISQEIVGRWHEVIGNIYENGSLLNGE